MTRRVVPFLAAFALAVLVVVGLSLTAGPTSDTPDAIIHAASQDTAGTVTTSDRVTITLTEDGAVPSSITVISGTTVVWYNDTDETQSMEVELDAVHRTFLPVVLRTNGTVAGGAQDNLSPTSVHLQGSFGVQIPSGGSYSYNYTTIGNFTFQLNLDSVLGNVLVAPQGTQQIDFDRNAGLLTLDVSNVSLLHILTMLEERFGLEVVVPELEDAPITETFQDVPVDDGLGIIVRPQGSRYHYVARGTEFETFVSSGVSRGEPTGNPPGGQYEKDQHPPVDDSNPKEPKPAPYDPELNGDPLKLQPEELDPVPPADGPKQAYARFYELEHGRFNFTIDSNNQISVTTGTAVGSGLVRSNRLAGTFIYRVTANGQSTLVGSMRDPLEVSVHGGPGHEHIPLGADEGLFNLSLPAEYLNDSYGPSLSDVAIEFYRLQQPLPASVTEPLSDSITTENFGSFENYLNPVDTVQGSELQSALSDTVTTAGVSDHYDVTTLLRSGSPGSKKNLVIVGDGFQASEQNDFNNFVDTYVMEGVFENGVLREIENAFNIYRINLDSTDSGVTQIDSDGDVTDSKDTALGYQYSGDWDRCWMEPGPDSTSTLNDILDHAVPEWDYVFIVLNESSGGGCRRGNTAAVTNNNPNGWATGNHELAHMVGNLGDEYFGDDNSYSGGEPSSVNLTKQTSRSSIKWNEWIHPGTSIPTECSDVSDNTGDVGLFEGATIGTTRYDNDLYRPTCTGRLRSSSRPHNPVGYKQMREMVDNFHEYSFRNTYAGDFDGDGRDDVVIHYGNTLALYLSTGGDLELEWVVTGELPGWDDFKQGDEFFVGDFDDDGMDDLYVFNSSDWVIPYFAMLRSTGSGFELVRRFDQKLPGWDDMKWRDEFFVGDYDGDGMDDIAVFNYGDWAVGYFQILRSTGSDLQYVKRYDEELPGWDDMKWRDQFFIGDFNADGNDDVYVFNYGDWSVGYLEMLRSTGSGLSYVERFDEELPGWDDMKQNDKFYVADFNGDGRDDLYVFNGHDWVMGYLQMLRSTGSNLANTRRYDGNVPGWDDLMPNDRFFVANVNGDEYDDLYVFNGRDWVTEYLGILTSSGTNLSGRWQDDWINSWNLHDYDQFAVGNFNGGAGWDDLFVYNHHFSTTNDWFGLLRSRKSSVGLNAIYRNWIHNHNYHEHGWW